MAITTGFQPVDRGSIPLTRSTQKTSYPDVFCYTVLMNISPLKIVISLVAVSFISYLLFGFFGIQALFMDRVVNEAVPEIALTEPLLPTTTTAAISATSSTTNTNPPTTKPVPLPTQPPAPASPKLLAQGSFTQGDSTYSINGKAMVTEKDGIRTLSLTNFDVTNGPDLFVYITEATSAENLTVKDAVRQQHFINLGTLKGNKGNQTYTLPKDLVLNENSLVTIWCRRFSRHFGSADLTLTP